MFHNTYYSFCGTGRMKNLMMKTQPTVVSSLYNKQQHLKTKYNQSYRCETT